MAQEMVITFLIPVVFLYIFLRFSCRITVLDCLGNVKGGKAFLTEGVSLLINKK